MSHICDIILWLRFILVYSLVLITLYIDAIISILWILNKVEFGITISIIYLLLLLVLVYIWIFIPTQYTKLSFLIWDRKIISKTFRYNKPYIYMYGLKYSDMEYLPARLITCAAASHVVESPHDRPLLWIHEYIYIYILLLYIYFFFTYEYHYIDYKLHIHILFPIQHTTIYYWYYLFSFYFT